MKRWFERLRAWLLAPVMEKLEGMRQDDLARWRALIKTLPQQIQAVREAISELPLPFDYSEKFDALHGLLAWPRLSAETLMVWEAVNYAAGKWDRDPLEEAVRLTEVTRWTNLFLKESKAPAVDKSMVADFLALRANLRKTRYPSL